MLTRVAFAVAVLVQACDGREHSNRAGHAQRLRQSAGRKLAAESVLPNATLEAEMAAKVGPDMEKQLEGLEATRDKIEVEIASVRTDAASEKDTGRRAELTAKADRMQTVEDQIKLHFGVVSATLDDDNSAQTPAANASVHTDVSQMALEARTAATQATNKLKLLQGKRAEIEGAITTLRTKAAAEKNPLRRDELTAKIGRMQKVQDLINQHFGVVDKIEDQIKVDGSLLKDNSAQTPVANASVHTDVTQMALEARMAATQAANELKLLQGKRAEIEAAITTLRTKAAAEKNPLRRAELTAKIGRMQKVQDLINHHFGAVDKIEDQIKVDGSLLKDNSAQTPVANTSVHTDVSQMALEARMAATQVANKLKLLLGKRAEIKGAIITLRTKAAAEKNPLRRAESTAKIGRMQKVQDLINQHFGAVDKIEDQIKVNALFKGNNI